MVKEPGQTFRLIVQARAKVTIPQSKKVEKGEGGKSHMPVYGNQKQHEPRYSRILTDITRTWVDMSASGGTRGESANRKTKIFFGCSKTRRCGCLLEKMHEGRPFVCANETSEGKPREDHHTEAGATGRSPHGSHQRSSHRHKQTAMPTCTLSTQTCMISYFRRQRILLLLFHSPTHPHGNQQENTCQTNKRRQSTVVG